MQKYLAFALVLGLAWGEASVVQGENRVGKGSKGNQSAEADKRGTEDSPLVVNEHTVQSKEEAAKEAARDAEQNRVNERIIDLTFAIAVCAGLQFLGILGQILVYLKQTKLMESTLDAIETQANEMALQHWEMEKQVEIMRDQTATLKDSVKASQTSADAAMSQIQLIKDKERSRLVLILQPLNEIGEILGDIEMQIGNFGATHAFDVRYGIWCELRESEKEPFDPYPDDVVGAIGIVRANADPERISEYVHISIGNEIKAGARKLFVHLSGKVEYEDVFGDSHFIRFQYICRISMLGDPIERDGITIFPIVGRDGWKKCPHPEHNAEG
jgi:hypothetical protein